MEELRKKGNPELLSEIAEEIKNLVSQARGRAALEVNKQLLASYWSIVRIIIEHEQEGKVRSQYGDCLLVDLSKRLTQELGRGFSKSNLFMQPTQIFQTRLEN